MIYIVFLISIIVSECASSKNKCSKSQFRLESMTHCHPYLTCSDFKNIKYIKLIGYGAVKWVFHALWEEKHQIAVSLLRNVELLEDFNEGLNVLKLLNPSHYVNQLVGYCSELNIIAAEYHPLNNANSLKYILNGDASSLISTIGLCINFVEILSYVHNSPSGCRVNCDSDSVTKILSQLLITDKLTLVLNDVDALPEIACNVSVNCGKKLISRPYSLIPPEITDPLNDGYSRGYTDKSDVWKVPDVCNYIFSLSGLNTIQYSLYSVHKRCKIENPSLRPTSKQLVLLYKNWFAGLNII